MLRAGDAPCGSSPRHKACLRAFQDGLANKGGGARPCRQAWTHSHRYSRAFLPCLRQVSITVSTRSTKRLPWGLSVPPLVFRNSTAARSERSPSLLVGSTPWTLTNVHSHSSCPSNSLQVPAVWLQPHTRPRRNVCRTACCTGAMALRNCARDSVP